MKYTGGNQKEQFYVRCEKVTSGKSSSQVRREKAAGKSFRDKEKELKRN